MTYKIAQNKLNSLCESVRKDLQGVKIILLRGVIGSGKTTFVKAFVGGDCITSPTFSIEQSYEDTNGEAVYHYDLYRKSLQEILELGLLDMLMREGWHLIEWGEADLERILLQSGFRVGVIGIECAANERIYEVRL